MKIQDYFKKHSQILYGIVLVLLIIYTISSCTYTYVPSQNTIKLDTLDIASTIQNKKHFLKMIYNII